MRGDDGHRGRQAARGAARLLARAIWDLPDRHRLARGLRFLHQRERFVSALVRPLVWLFIFAAGFRQVLGVSIIPPYETYVLYEVYHRPG